MISQKLRRDGFDGQHLVVVPKPVRDEAMRHPLLRSLLVTDAGYFPQARGHYVEREKGAPTHLLIACLRGRGWLRTVKEERQVKPGDLVWLRSNQPHAYGSQPEDPWTIGWVHFTGDEAESWRRHIGFPDDASLLNQVTAEGITGLKLEQIYLSLEHGYSIPDLISTTIMLRGAFDVAARAVRQGEGATRSASERIAAVREHLRENLAHAHRLDELAAAAGLSVPHFCALFRRQTGYAPIDFLIRQRIQRACKLLDTTDASIASIAAEVGYEDAYYFTRCFRRIVGCPPRSYRRIPKG